MHTTRFWNYLSTGRLKIEILESQIINVLGAIKRKGINRIAKIGYGHLGYGHLCPGIGEPYGVIYNSIFIYFFTVNFSNKYISGTNSKKGVRFHEFWCSMIIRT